MFYVFIEPISIASLLIIFIFFLILFVFLSYFFFKRMKISALKKMPTALVVGFPNSGRSFIIKELCKASTGIYDKILNLNYVDFMHDGRPMLKIIDHQAIFSKDGKVDHKGFGDLKHVDPKCIIGIIDVSRYSDPLDEQIDFLRKVKKRFKGKKFFSVANKVGRKSGKKLKKIEADLGGKIYKIRMNKPDDVEKLRKDITNYLKLS